MNHSSIRFIEDFPKTLEITGEKVPLDLVGPSAFFIIDSLLVIQNYNQSNYLSVYNLCHLNKIIQKKHALIPTRLQARKKQIAYTRHNLQNEISREYILYDKITDIERNQVGSADKIKPDFKKLAQAMLQFDQINILDLEQEEHLSLTTCRNFMHLPLDDSKEPNMYYSDLCVTDKQIYALYANQPITRWGLDSKKSEIQVYDWNGNPVCKIIVPEYLLYINIDEKNKQLYGITADEELYRFSIQDIL